MTDTDARLIERGFVQHLRDKAKRTHDIGDSTDFTEAADRIESLTAEVGHKDAAFAEIMREYREHDAAAIDVMFDIARAALESSK